MSLINLVSLITLALVLTLGVAVRRSLKRYFENIDGLVGITNQNEIENK